MVFLETSSAHAAVSVWRSKSSRRELTHAARAGKQNALDGKSIRATLEAGNGKSARDMVIAWVCEHQLVDPYGTDMKSSEIEALLMGSERTHRGLTSCERRAYISSCDELAAALAAKVRGRWSLASEEQGPVGAGPDEQVVLAP